MCKTRILDVQNELDAAVCAFDGLRDLFREAEGPGKQGYDALRPEGIAQLMDLVGERFHRARDLLDTVRGEVVPR
jgi:hypothetical protein